MQSRLKATRRRVTCLFSVGHYLRFFQCRKFIQASHLSSEIGWAPFRGNLIKKGTDGMKIEPQHSTTDKFVVTIFKLRQKIIVAILKKTICVPMTRILLRQTYYFERTRETPQLGTTWVYTITRRMFLFATPNKFRMMHHKKSNMVSIYSLLTGAAMHALFYSQAQTQGVLTGWPVMIWEKWSPKNETFHGVLCSVQTINFKQNKHCLCNIFFSPTFLP